MFLARKMVKIRKINLISYEVFILVGALIAIGSLLKIFNVYNFSSDWFWVLAGIGLAVEGAISLVKQRRFDKKYKIIEKK